MSAQADTRFINGLLAQGTAARSTDLGILNDATTVSGLIGATNVLASYRFQIKTASSFRLSLNGMSADADVRLIHDRNRNGTVDSGEELARSDRSLNYDEVITSRSLTPGDYIVQVYQGTPNHSTHYRLGLAATALNSTSSGLDLVGQFGAIDLPDIRQAGDQGQAQVRVANQGTQSLNGAVTVSLYASTDANYDSNDELLNRNSLSLNLTPGQAQTYTLNFAAPTVVAPGAYFLLARIDSANDIAESNEANNLISTAVSAPGTDVVVDWNAVLLNAIQSVATAPPLAARHQALVHVAIYDAVNAITRTHRPYHVTIDATAAVGASAEAAAAAAAHRTLSALYPSLRATLDAQLQRSLAEIPDGAAETRGVAIGNQVADQILALRSNDRSNRVQEAYTPGSAPGSYLPTRVDDFVLMPRWGTVTPFALSSLTPFIPSGPPAYGSAQYAVEFNQVKALGAYDSTARTADQSEIAVFWAYDRPDTFRPPAQWNQIAQTIAIQQGTSLAENARLFALLNIAQADAGIVAWATKYAYKQLRPVTAVHLADSDGHPQTTGDPNWQPLLPTPPFPDYISGHSTFGAAAAGILAAFFGNNYGFSVTSQELPGVYRSFNSFQAAAAENGISRIYGGIHVASANQDGLATGYAVADYVVRNLLV